MTRAPRATQTRTPRAARQGNAPGRVTVLITGFGPFPGAPFNPTAALVARLARRRRPALADVSRPSHVFATRYADVDRELPQLIARYRPDAILMFGLAPRRPHLSVEAQARNVVSALIPDAGRSRSRAARIVPGGAPALAFGPHVAQLLRAAQASGGIAHLSRNAGSYLCNYLSWRAIEAAARPGGPKCVAFIHVPLPRRVLPHGRRRRPRPDLDELARAGEAILLALVQVVRAG